MAQSENSVLASSCVSRDSRGSPAWVRGQGADWKHVCIGPISGLDVRLPLRQSVKGVADAEGKFAAVFVFGGPDVPMIVGNAP
jgi:hypothetical protein